jgi:hypothetical protein
MVVEANLPVPPSVDSPGETWFAFHVDPNAATKALLYFLSDGTLWRSEVTSTPIGEEPTTQQFDRRNNRYERFVAGFGSNTPYEATGSKTNLPIPGMVLVHTEVPTVRQLIINVPESTVSPDIYEPDAIELYRMPNGGDGALYLSAPMPESRVLIVNVTSAVSPATITWAVRTVRGTPELHSPYVRAIDDNIPDADALIGAWGSSTPFEASMSKVDRAPIKKSFQEANFIPGRGSSTPFEASMSKVDRAPIKENFEEPSITSSWGTSTPYEATVSKS